MAGADRSGAAARDPPLRRTTASRVPGNHGRRDWPDLPFGAWIPDLEATDEQWNDRTGPAGSGKRPRWRSGVLYLEGEDPLPAAQTARKPIRQAAEYNTTAHFLYAWELIQLSQTHVQGWRSAGALSIAAGRAGGLPLAPDRDFCFVPTEFDDRAFASDQRGGGRGA